MTARFALPRRLANVGLTHTETPRLTEGNWRCYVGIFGVLLGAIMGTLGSRATSFGLADLRGALHAGFDEGAWITTSFGVAQMLMGVASPYLGAIFGARRVLLTGIGVFFAASLLGPFSTGLPGYLILLFLAGLGSGTFIPLTISFVIRTLPARLLVFGLAIYAMNSELSQNIAASLEGWYVDHLTWRWIEWQYCVASLAMFAAIWFGVPREDTKFELIQHFDWWGLTYAGLGFALLYAGLDQGNRLDWQNSGLVCGLLAGGGILATAFLVREMTASRPFLNLRILLRGNLPLLMIALAGFRFIILSTAYIIPTYLQSVQSFRELQVGRVLLWIALPQLLLVVPVAVLLGKIDGRLVLAAGSALIGIACLMASLVTSVWSTGDFLPSQVLQAVGQSLALTALVVLVVRSTIPAEALTIGCLLQISRLFGGEIGTTFMQTFVRTREQVHSNFIGLHIQQGAALSVERLADYAAQLSSRGAESGLASSQALSLLKSAVATQADVLAYADGFAAAAVAALGCLILVAVMQRPQAGS
jgi:DHA2 family multidrug resistance protein